MGGMDWIDLAQDRDRWPVVVHVGFRKVRGICGQAEDVLASQQGVCHPHRLYAHKIFSERPSKQDSCCKTCPFPCAIVQPTEGPESLLVVISGAIRYCT